MPNVYDDRQGGEIPAVVRQKMVSALEVLIREMSLAAKYSHDAETLQGMMTLSRGSSPILMVIRWGG